MSNTSTFAFGLGGGLALWQLLQSTPVAPPGVSQLRNSRRGVCVVELDPTGLTVDGTHVDLGEAVRRAQVAGCVLVTAAPDAPAATYAALLAALRDANVPTHARTRVAARNARLDTKTEFTLITYPQGHKEASTSRWFRTEAPISWNEARDRLINAGIIDPKLAGRTHAPGGWMLSIDPTQFQTARAEPLPGVTRNSYISTTFTLVVYPEGVDGPQTTRWFRAGAPTTWDVACERLADAGFLDPDITLPAQSGYWVLFSAPGPFNESKAEPLPARRLERNAELASTFSLVEFPDGIWGKKRVRWFRAESPTTWEDARDRLSAAYQIDRTADTWKLFTDPARFRGDRAQPLPAHTPVPEGRRPRGAGSTGRFAVDGGRTIVRDGEALVRIERVDLGNERYALSPHETDKLTQRIVRLLNKHGAR